MIFRIKFGNYVSGRLRTDCKTKDELIEKVLGGLDLVVEDDFTSALLHLDKEVKELGGEPLAAWEAWKELIIKAKEANDILDRLK